MRHIPLTLVNLESGDYCKKYNQFIDSQTIETCKKKGTYRIIGCSKCPYRTFEIKLKQKKQTKGGQYENTNYNTTKNPIHN